MAKKGKTKIRSIIFFAVLTLLFSSTLYSGTLTWKQVQTPGSNVIHVTVTNISAGYYGVLVWSAIPPVPTPCNTITGTTIRNCHYTTCDSNTKNCYYEADINITDCYFDNIALFQANDNPNGNYNEDTTCNPFSNIAMVYPYCFGTATITPSITRTCCSRHCGGKDCGRRFYSRRRAASTGSMLRPQAIPTAGVTRGRTRRSRRWCSEPRRHTRWGPGPVRPWPGTHTGGAPRPFHPREPPCRQSCKTRSSHRE